MKQIYKIERKEYWLDGRVDVAIIDRNITSLTELKYQMWAYAEALKDSHAYTRLELGEGYSIVYFTLNSNRHRVEFTRLPNITDIA